MSLGHVALLRPIEDNIRRWQATDDNRLITQGIDFLLPPVLISNLYVELSLIGTDANGTGTVSADDYASVQAHFGEMSGVGGASVPEPGTISLLVLGGLAMFRRHSAQVLRRKK